MVNYFDVEIGELLCLMELLLFNGATFGILMFFWNLNVLLAFKIRIFIRSENYIYGVPLFRTPQIGPCTASVGHQC